MLVAAFVPGMGESRGERLGTLVQNAQDEYARAGASPDPAVVAGTSTKRGGWPARHCASTRRTRWPRTCAASPPPASTAMDAVIDLGGMNTLTTLSKQVTGEVQIVSTIVQGGNVYMLDTRAAACCR